MVSFALDQPNNGRLRVAGELTERFEAAIVGVAAAKFAPPLHFADGAEAQGLIDREQNSVRKRLTNLEAQFPRRDEGARRTCAMAQRHGFPTRFVLAQVRCADIGVSGGHSPAFPMPFRSQARRIW
ncbi:hypothetical protein ACTGJ9_012160 [Bradyrhizobium sp. RDM12]